MEPAAPGTEDDLVDFNSLNKKVNIVYRNTTHEVLCCVSLFLVFIFKR